MAGKLYLCATPIGNLEDITYRVVRTLNEVDLIGAEDTRNSIKLLNHFDIKTPMTSYHEFNKYDKAKQLVEMMKEGKNIAIITDAGTPGISDPGEEVVRQCFEAGIQVTSLPGPAACITALTMSGQKTRRFCFEAFLPKDKKEKVAVLEELKNEIMLTFLRTQNLIISSYFNTAFNKISTLEDVEKYRRKLYNFKDYLGSTDGYTFYHDYYVEQMAKLEHKYNILENGGNETALDVKNKKENLFISLLKKIKDLFIKKDTNMQESK